MSYRETVYDTLRRLSQHCVVLFLLLAAPVAFAGTTGKIAGRVVDGATGEPIPGVQIVIEQSGQGTVTDIDGYYDILNIRPGTYAVIFKYVGYADTRVENVGVIVDKTTTIDVQMREQVLEGQEVVVTAERPIVQMDRTTTTAFVDEKQISVLPVANIGDIINLQAGVVDGHFRGGRQGEVAYLVNGVPINNPTSNTAAFDIEKNMVSGLEVISGVFNAEYGQAMSGIVNIVTKDVPSAWNGSISTEIGGTASMREIEYVRRNAEPGTNLRASDFSTERVPYYEAAGFPGRRDVQASIGGPLLKERLGFQLSGRYFYNEGNIIARNLFAPGDSSQNVNASSNPDDWIIASTGNQKFTPDEHNRYSVNSTLTYRLTKAFRVEYNVIYQKNNGWSLNAGNYRSRKYVPEGINRYYNTSQFHLVGLRMTLGSNAFANLNYSYLRDNGGSRLYDEPDNFDETGVLDPRYVSDRLNSLQGQRGFGMGGNDLNIGEETAAAHTILGDYTNQITRAHQMKAGFSVRMHHLSRGGYGIELDQNTNWLPIPSRSPYGRDTLDVKPLEIAGYIQDKMEVKNLIVNAGVRFDYFDANYRIPISWDQADSLLIPTFNDAGQVTGYVSNREEAPIRWQISPRVGIAFPISANGVIRFSAGLFFQTPQFNLLFRNAAYEINPNSTEVNFGNPALNPERTLQFEIGLQQGLTESMGLELTLFSKDIRNLIGVETRRVRGGQPFVRLMNQDTGTSRGITLSLFQRPTGPLSWDVDYTLQFASGSSSNPDEAFQRWLREEGDILTLVRLDWDRRHVLTNSITFAPSTGLTMTMINRFQSGTPYTSVRTHTTSYVRNNLDRPSNFYSDLRVYYRVPFANALSLSMQVDNLFDTRAHTGIYSDTGRSDESVEMEEFRRAGSVVGGLNSLDEYYIEQWRFSGPRRVILGLRYEF